MQFDKNVNKLLVGFLLVVPGLLSLILSAFVKYFYLHLLFIAVKSPMGGCFYCQ